RGYVLERLRQMDIEMEAEPSGAFYVWANLSRLPKPLNDGMSFFREGLKEKVIIVPGVFFDVNPGNRRLSGRYENYCRISFGPELKKLEIGLDGLQRVIAKFGWSSVSAGPSLTHPSPYPLPVRGDGDTADRVGSANYL